MGVVAAVLATVVVGLLVFVAPRRGRARFRQLQLDVLTDPLARTRYYRRTIAAAWIMTGFVALIGLLAGAAGHDIALPEASSASRSAARLITVELLVLIPVSAVVMRSRAPSIQKLVRRQIGHLKALLPVTRQERTLFVAVALTAGICEEVVFRWFGITYVRWLAPESSNLVVIAAIGVVFGFGHLYQGKVGVLMTGLAGAMFTWLTLSAGSLLPAIAIHVLVDLRVAALREVTDPDPEPDPQLAGLPHPPT